MYSTLTIVLIVCFIALVGCVIVLSIIAFKEYKKVQLSLAKLKKREEAKIARMIKTGLNSH